MRSDLQDEDDKFDIVDSEPEDIQRPVNSINPDQYPHRKRMSANEIALLMHDTKNTVATRGWDAYYKEIAEKKEKERLRKQKEDEKKAETMI